MSGRAVSAEDNEAIGRINGTLRGPVTEILQDLVPELRASTRRGAYERIMNDPHLAARCFREFRAQPERFRYVLTGADDTPVTSDEQKLSCGRSLAQVIALVVRAVAKRHFRARLGFVRKNAVQKAKRPGLFQVIFGAFNPPAPVPPPRKEYSRADALYQAMRSFLLFEWQVTLIPHYAHLPVALVRELGPRLLEYTNAEQIQTLARDGKAPPAQDGSDAMRPSGMVPRQSDSAQPVVAPQLRIDTLWSFSLRFGLPVLFGCDDRAMRRLVEVVQGSGGPILSVLAQAGLHPPEAAVTTICVVHRLGADRFEKVVREHTFPRDFGRVAREKNIASMKSADDIRKTVNAILAVVIPTRPRA
ncbi:hypothetical protein [Telmatospirillum sp.]|uniref:hypothetical protein n=1 Tax=Telmatospirillum sp. TaxID=2079197 RepID=UPI00283D996F|nr:hypothetical protein [Telmatospirillum sp.]MDR3439484.1 hypothetical protein [Telmatospirillum sp.]